jgi:hypothetical protein
LDISAYGPTPFPYGGAPPVSPQLPAKPPAKIVISSASKSLVTGEPKDEFHLRLRAFKETVLDDPWFEQAPYRTTVRDVAKIVYCLGVDHQRGRVDWSLLREALDDLQEHKMRLKNLMEENTDAMLTKAYRIFLKASESITGRITGDLQDMDAIESKVNSAEAVRPLDNWLLRLHESQSQIVKSPAP